MQIDQFGFSPRQQGCQFIQQNQLMQRWQEQQRQRAHYYMIEQAKPTIKRYSRSRDKGNLAPSRLKNITGNVNLPFRQVLSLFQLQKYQQLLFNFGFPDKIKSKESIALIDDMIKKVQEEDLERFYSLMNALLAISTELKSSTKRTPLVRRKVTKNYPPIYASSNLKKCDSIVTKKGEKTPAPNFRIKSKSNIHHLSIKQTPKTADRTVIKYSLKAKARDDSTIIHEFGVKGNTKIRDISKSNSLIGRIQQRLRKMKCFQQKQSNSDAKLFYNQIKQMYLSYDTATLTSNIINIDIEEIIDCFAIEIENMIHEPLNPEKSMLKSQKQHIEKLLKQSLIATNKINSQQSESQDLNHSVDETISVGSADSQKTSFAETDMSFDYQLQSIAKDLTCFNYSYEDQTNGGCSRKDIKNFVQLVMMAGRMQKEAPIISFSYVKRVLGECKREGLSPQNWKNIVLISLIQASKIWDDQSLENHSFAKMIQPYTTLEINRLQRHLLTFLDYRLQIEAKEYCESYFNLRKHINSSCKTVHLMHLNLQTIKKLQSGTRKCQKNLKQTYKKKLNESF